MPRLIVFNGAVGSGKSTQIKLIASELANSGLKVKSVYFKTDHLLLYLFEKAIVRLLVKNESSSVSLTRFLIDNKPKLLLKIFKPLLALDMLISLIKFIFSIYVPLKMKRVVIVEEYIPSAISTVIYRARLLGLPIRDIKPYLSFMLRLLHLGGPFQVFFLDAKDEVLRERWNRRRSSSERQDYLQMQRTTLLQLSKKLSQSFIYIDTSEKGVNDIYRMIMKFLMIE